MTGLLSRIGSAWLAGSIIAVLLIGATPATVAAASGMSIQADMGLDELRVTAAPNTTLALTWKDADGVLKEKGSVTTSGGGYAYYEPADGSVVAIGDRIRISDGTHKHVLVVPKVTINVNRVRNTLKGSGPAGDIIRLRCGGGPLPSFEPCIWKDRVRVGSTGHWGLHIKWNFYGGSTFYALWRSSAGDKIWVAGVAPFLDVTIGRAGLSGAFRPGKTADIIVRDGSTLATLATGSAVGDPSDGEFSGHFRSGGARYKIMPGDRITSDISTDLDFEVPDIQVTADAKTDKVRGQCFATGYANLRIDVYRNGFHRGFAYDDTDETSQFSTYMPHPGTIAYNPAVIKVGDRVSVACMTSEGDWIRVWTTAS